MARHAGKGWKQYRWRLQNGVATVNTRNAPAASMAQVVRDRSIRRGIHRLTVELANQERSGNSNGIYVMLYGVNGLFEMNVDYKSGPQPLSAAPMQSRTLLSAGSLGGNSFNFKTFSFDVDLGAGYEYLVARIFTTNVDSSRGDIVQVRKVSLV
jgi:hypothetical protein